MHTYMDARIYKTTGMGTSCKTDDASDKWEGMNWRNILINCLIKEK